MKNVINIDSLINIITFEVGFLPLLVGLLELLVVDLYIVDVLEVGLCIVDGLVEDLYCLQVVHLYLILEDLLAHLLVGLYFLLEEVLFLSHLLHLLLVPIFSIELLI